MSHPLETRFAPAERAPQSVVEDQCRCVETLPLVKKMIDSVPDAVMVLNAHRQIINANQVFLDLLGLEDKMLLCGLRPGEALNCIHSSNETGGCGTTEFCSTCGGTNAILASQRGTRTIGECTITRKGYAEILEFRVMATPLEMDGREFTVFSLSDINHEKRRRLLERIFFHDILNFAVGLRGFSQLLKEADTDQIEQFRGTIHQLSDQLVEEINAQRDLIAAEHNEYVPRPVSSNSRKILDEIHNVYENHDVARGLTLRIDPAAQETTFVSDKTLLRRIIGNMTKNALEASEPGDTVTLGCDVSDKVRFWVHNPAVIPRDIQLQVFTRSFSTKGKDRGLGTYGMKLFGERYLGGSADFVSSPGTGTIFSFTLPARA